MTTHLTDNEGEVFELTDQDVSAMKTMSDALPADLLSAIGKRGRGQRGKQKAPTKIRTTIRLSPEVVDYFKEHSENKGWQTMVDQALKQYIREHA